MCTHTFTNNTMVVSIENKPRRRSLIELLPRISRVASQLSVLIFKTHHVQLRLDIIQTLLIFLFTALLKDIVFAFDFNCTRKGKFKNVFNVKSDQLTQLKIIK